MTGLWTSQDAAIATAGKNTAEWNASRVVIDSRQIKNGDLFVALKGERFDGHDFVAKAGQAGAVAAVVSQKVDCALPQLVVCDTTKALEDLGKAGRTRSKAKIIGVTGSVGKTGTKEMLGIAFGALGKTFITQGNLNNHLGVPFSLANMAQDVAYGVLEMGMNHAGEISFLTKMVRPDAAIITTIEAAHLEFFNSADAIADAKAEIFEGMQASGIAALNIDNPQFERLLQSAKKQGLSHILRFGAAEAADCRLLDYQVKEFGAQVDAWIDHTNMTYRLGALGRHWALISTAVLGIVGALGGDIARAAEALAQFREPEGRGRLSRVPLGNGYITLVDDSYNASPASMAAAFGKMSDIRGMEKTRTIAILGDMLELGPTSGSLHAGLRAPLVDNRLDQVHVAGPLMRELYNALPENMRGIHEGSAAELAKKVIATLQPGDIVLVKGSHGSKMYDIARMIAMLAQTEEENAL